MPCYHPIDAWRSAKGVFFRDTIDSSKIKLPCGRCIGCKLERSRQWAVRLTHELRFHELSSFITLTYSEEHLPKSGSLDVKVFQDFMKRFRKAIYPRKIRFFHAGEYGEKRGRPHYHAIIFGESFSCGRCSVSMPLKCSLCGAYGFEKSPRGDVTWLSPALDRLWGFGLARVGAVTFESAAYVARYCTKKITGPNARDHYERICEVTGEVFQLKPEYATMSRRPGIGAQHFERYSSEIYPHDNIAVRGVLCKPPIFYDRMLEKRDPMAYALLKEEREFALVLSPSQDRTPRRLAEREVCKLAQVGQLSRRYEIG